MAQKKYKLAFSIYCLIIIIVIFWSTNSIAGKNNICYFLACPRKGKGCIILTNFAFIACIVDIEGNFTSFIIKTIGKKTELKKIVFSG